MAVRFPAPSLRPGPVEFKRGPFNAWRDREGRLGGLDLLVEQPVEVVVAVVGIVVKGHEMFNLGQLGELEGMGHGTVTPTHPGLVLFGRILAIVDQ